MANWWKCLLVLFLLCFNEVYSDSPIKHVVTLMMENHSFDNILGWVPGIGDLTGEEYNLLDPADTNSQKFYVGKGADYCTLPDPNHDLPSTSYQLYAPFSPPDNGAGTPTNGGFAANFNSITGSPQTIMNCFTPDQLPATTTLASTFTTCTNFFAGLPGPTNPNRLFAHSATSMGYTENIFNSVNVNTIYQSLMHNDPPYDWGIHYQDFSVAHLISPLNTYPNIIQDYGLTVFYEKIKNETLPNYTFLTPLISPYQDMYPNTQHPVYDIRGGDMLIKEVYESLRNSTYWNTTLLIITYDEHGGFWDKKAPPTAVNPTPNAKSDPDPFNFTRAGVRIPTILVSPWLPSAVDDVIYDLSSVPASIKKLFNLTAPFLSDRDAVANTFANQFLQQMRTDTPLTLPPPPSGPWCYPAKEKTSWITKRWY